MVATFGAVLALNGADTSTVSAIAPQLEGALHIGNTYAADVATATASEEHEHVARRRRQAR